MPKNTSLQLILSDGKNHPAASTSVLLLDYISQDAITLFHFFSRALHTLLRPLFEGSHNILSSVKHWGLIAKNLSHRIQPVGECSPIIPGLLLNELLINSGIASAYFFPVMMLQLFSFCVLATLLKSPDQSGSQFSNKLMPVVFSVCLRNLNLAISKSIQLSNTEFCSVYTALSATETCDSASTILSRLLGIPMTVLSSMLLLQLANRISMATTAWHMRQTIAAKAQYVTLSSTPLFEMAATIATAALLSMQKSILLQVQGGVVLYQYLSPSRVGLSQYTSLGTFFLTVMPSLITEVQSILMSNKHCRVHNSKQFDVLSCSDVVVRKSLQNIRYGDVIVLTADGSGKLLLPKAFGVLTAKSPIVLVYNKSGINGEPDKYTIHIGKENHINNRLKILGNDDAGQWFENGLIIAPGIEIEKVAENTVFYFRIYPSRSAKTQVHQLEYTYQNDLSQLNAETIRHVLFFTFCITVLQLIATNIGTQSKFSSKIAGKLFRNFFDYTQISLPLGVTALLSSQILLYFKKNPQYSHLTVSQKDKLITLAAHVQQLIDDKREVVIVSDKTGTVTTAQIQCHGIIPIRVTQAAANLVVLATYQGLLKETEAEEHALLEKINESCLVEIESLCDTKRVFKKTLDDKTIVSWQLGFMRDITAAVTLVKQDNRYRLIFATGKLPPDIDQSHFLVFKNHCETQSQEDLIQRKARFRRDWAYTQSELSDDNQLIQSIQTICAENKAGTKISNEALLDIIPVLKEELRASTLIVIANNTNTLKIGATEFLDHYNRHLLTGDNARACVGFAKILFPNKTIFIFDSITQCYKNADFSDIDSFQVESFTSNHLLIIANFKKSEEILLSNIIAKPASARPYLMFSDCTPETKAEITQQLYLRKNRPFIVGFGDGANDAKMLECVDLSVSCLINGVKINSNAHFTDEEIMQCFGKSDLLTLFKHFKISTQDKIVNELSPVLCMMEKANPLFYAKASKLAFALFFGKIVSPQKNLFQLEILFDFSIYALFSKTLSQCSLSLYDVKPISARGCDYTKLIVSHVISANLLACFMYGIAKLFDSDARAATLYALLIVPFYWKYHTQLMERYGKKSPTLFTIQHEGQKENALYETSHPMRAEKIL